MDSTLIAANNVRLLNHSVRKDGVMVGIIGCKSDKILAELISKFAKTTVKPLNTEVKKVAYGVAQKFVAPTEVALRKALKEIKSAATAITKVQVEADKAKAETAAKKVEAKEAKKDTAPKGKLIKKDKKDKANKK